MRQPDEQCGQARCALYGKHVSQNASQRRAVFFWLCWLRVMRHCSSFTSSLGLMPPATLRITGRKVSMGQLATGRLPCARHQHAQARSRRAISEAMLESPAGPGKQWKSVTTYTHPGPFYSWFYSGRSAPQRVSRVSGGVWLGRSWGSYRPGAGAPLRCRTSRLFNPTHPSIPTGIRVFRVHFEHQAPVLASEPPPLVLQLDDRRLLVGQKAFG